MSWKRPKRRNPWLILFPEFLRTPLVIAYRILLAGLCVFLAIAGFYYFLSLKYPIADIKKLPQQATILDCHGLEISTLHSSSAHRVTHSEIPKHFTDALLAREDARFFHHHGVDLRGLLRATARNIKDRSLTQGASTLSMQLTRNSFELKEKSLHRKCLEIAITLRMETQFSKEDILTNYLNRIYFGSGCYGIEQAAQRYFDKTTSELDLSESALIVGIIRGPHIFSPLKDLESAIEQRNQTLKRMLSTSAITKEQYDTATQSNINLSEDNPTNHSSYAVSSIKRHLQVIMDQHDIRSDGLQVHTSIDLKKNSELQKTLHKILTAHTAESEALQTAAITIEHSSGAIRRLIGGVDFTKSSYNRALDSRRDLGSVLTPFIDLAALERNRTPVRNQPVLTGRQIGAQETIRILKRVGLKGPFQSTEDLFRGAAAASPLELATAYSSLAAKGQRPHTYFIEKITLMDGTVLFQNSPSPSSISEPENATRSLLSMQDQAKGNTYQRSGTTGSERDFWSIYIGPDETTVIWVGYDRPAKLPTAKLLDTIPHTLP